MEVGVAVLLGKCCQQEGDIVFELPSRVDLRIILAILHRLMPRAAYASTNTFMVKYDACHP